MSDSETALHCGNCNQKTQHQRLKPAEIEAQKQQKNSAKSQWLNLIVGVFLGTHKSETHISYFKCKVCGAEYDDRENLPHGWG
ncbi:hypothetical protein J4N45_26710 [Vibrio sp. SCSIO 43140]|uniref:hypothetical protein n=1 Tax=Vibrio sp. SCSIO 43140 TaxID=2819100 RepID=UPI002075E675|nr:hypothetical protein [Vibrio sp. SCSIO 43140]USD62941.1 hypothetical protein J4N45_26710 [Vibrio sp. SCSIO 43140]